MSTFSMSTIWFTFGKCTNLELLSIPTLDICTSWKHQIFYSLWPRECGLIGSCEWWLGFIASLVLSANHCLPHPALHIRKSFPWPTYGYHVIAQNLKALNPRGSPQLTRQTTQIKMTQSSVRPIRFSFSERESDVKMLYFDHLVVKSPE